ncbi:unnamed protein product [Didymodactylos carnosus]|uniref:GRIP domain-containing protein n=1 Tax=Didymodactylos carnosus TaxID=1234261 RepID=A0A813TC40_9BILA|nr:unnamed protein product [Didymodactylos carnosus]CAF1049719.1 unnamed protein product [Didymodactylos carnosus]CAF3593157.1 unnamed protein product [Didymodactylos carnosus]CAF3816671.1 unnamed protein product [Didymodactylos carnosus]
MSKSEYLKTIENQQQRITRLEQRFSDVVTAYKNLQKEKDALESTMKILSSASSTGTGTTLSSMVANGVINNAIIKENNDSGSEAESGISTGTSSVVEQTIQDKLNTLQQNVTIITEQKTKMELMYQTEKKKLKTENEELKGLLDEAKAENIILNQKYETELKELKSRFRQSQRDREREVADHGVMVRELQTLVSAERNTRELIEQQLEECRVKISPLESQIEKFKKENLNLTQQYQSKLSETKEKGASDIEDMKRSKEKINELQIQLKDLETKYNDELRTASKQNQYIEKKMNSLINENEVKVAKLETHIAELSDQIGAIEKQRSQDQLIIQRLKDRISQLNMENSVLTTASSTSIEQDLNGDDETKSNDIDIEQNTNDLDTLMKRISKLKVLIRLVNERFGKALTIEDVLNIDREVGKDSISTTTNGHPSDQLHTKCHEEMDRLKSELEKYKTKTLAAFKAKTFKETNTTKEMDDLRAQMEQLREKLYSTQTLYNNENQRHMHVVEKLETCLKTINEQHRQEVEQMMSKKRIEINELECELEKHRERTARILNEKEREIEAIKKLFTGETTKLNENEEILTVSTEDSTSVNDLFSRSCSSPPLPITDNVNLLYFVQEQQLRDQELSQLRKQRRELELSLRDIQQHHSYEINQLKQTIEQLNDDIEHLKLSNIRNNTTVHDFDYIKNVFYHYLITNDISVKQTMVNALMTILHFSSKEKLKINDYQKKANTISWFYNTNPNK